MWIEIMNYGLEFHLKGKTFKNVEELEEQVCRRLDMKVKLNKPFIQPDLDKKLMVKVDIKEEKHPNVGIEFIYVNNIEVVEI